MKIKYLEINLDTLQQEALVSLSVQDIILIQDAINLYKGDQDDPNVIKTKQELKKELHEAWKQLRPS
jgi:hypothetical protein